MPLPNLGQSESDYKFSIVYAWHPDSPTIPIALHELKTKSDNKNLKVGDLKLGTVGNRKHKYFFVWPNH